MAEEKIENPMLEELKKEINILKGKLTTFETKKEELLEQKKELINKNIYENKRKIEDTYGEVLTEAEKRLEATKKEKEDEKKKNLANLVEKNTRGTREKNVYLNNEIHRIIKENKLPGFVNTNFYFCLWSPYTILQGLVGFLIIVLIFAIPTFCCFVLFKQKLEDMFPMLLIRIIVIAFIYVIVVFVFGAIWLLIERMTKKNPEVIKQIKELRKQIKENNREIISIAKKTNDTITEDQFDYTKLDREIEAENIELENRKKERDEALEKFNTITQQEITKKIEDDMAQIIAETETEIENVKNELSIKQKEYDDLKISNI